MEDIPLPSEWVWSPEPAMRARPNTHPCSLPRGPGMAWSQLMHLVWPWRLLRFKYLLGFRTFLYRSVVVEGCLFSLSPAECTLLSCHPASFQGPSDLPTSSKERAPARHIRGSRPLLQAGPYRLLQSL